MMKSALSSPLQLQDVLKLVEPDLVHVEAALQQKVDSAVPIVKEINTYIHASGGKRLRPALAVLCSKMFGHDGDSIAQLGVVLELIHAATLVHDDIIDNAKLRRGRPAVNSKWGNQVTVLMGDWLYMSSFHLALELREEKVLDILIGITRKMVEGELMQLEHSGRLEITQDEQMAINLRKTAWLFAGCGQLAAIVARQSREVQDKLWNYGRSFGLAFQLIDDQLDYTATQSSLGKPVLKDLEEGKVTLPIIYLMQRATEAERSFMGRVVENQDFSFENKQRIIRMVNDCGALGDLRREAEVHAAQARAFLQEMPDNIYRDSLLALPEFVLNRNV